MSTELVAYFSAEGTTARVARTLADERGADLCEIRPTTPYTQADLDWHDAHSRSSVEMHDESARPAMQADLEGVAGYERIYLGFPIWWYREPSIIDTFLEAYDLSGTDIVLFATSGSSGFGDTAERIRGLIGQGARVSEGTVFTASATDSDVDAWIAGLE